MQPEQGQRTQTADDPASGPGAIPPSGRTGPAERTVFRLPGAAVAWWAWVVVAAACLADLALSGRDHTSAEIAAGLVVITGVVYACVLRPGVIADDDGVTVRNPLRDHRIPWGSVTAVDLAESVRVHCALEPGARREKVIHSWALYAQRRSRVRAEFGRARLSRSGYSPNDRAPAEAQRIARQPTAQIMATQLGELAAKARSSGAEAGPRTVSWAWPSVVAVVAPAIALVLVITLIH
jgi:hypothetical protein